MSQQFEKEYTADLVDIIELLYGTDFLSQGGPAAVDQMLLGIDLNNKIIADIGCGNGGPLIHIAKNYPLAKAIGVDVDPDLLQKAEGNSTAENLDQCQWIQSIPEQALPLESNSVDIIIGKESWLHVKDKTFFFKEIHRILKPGGIMLGIDWMHKSRDYSNLMKHFVLADGLTFHLCTIAEYLEYIKEAGFSDIKHQEKSADALHHSRHDVDQLLDDDFANQFKQRFDEDTYNIWLASWLMQSEVFARGEMQTFQITAHKPK